MQHLQNNNYESKVLKLWEGLGYYRRARNLLATSKILVNEKNSKLPKNIIDIKKIPKKNTNENKILLTIFIKVTLIQKVSVFY